RGGPVRELPGPGLADQRADRRSAGADVAVHRQRHGTEDGGLPARGTRRRTPGTRDRWPAGALGAAGGLHQRRSGNDGGAGMSESSTQSASGQGGLTARWQSAMMNNYGTPPLALVRGSGA